MNKLSGIYAKALFEIALEEHMDKQILEETCMLAETFSQTPEFIKVLDAPMIERSEKLAVIDNTLKDQVSCYTLNFLKVMVDRKACALLKESFGEYENLYNKHYNIEKVVATTAVPLTEELTTKLREKLEKTTGKTILLHNKVDPEILGGVVLKFADKQLDDSVAHKLKKLKAELAAI